MGERKKNCNWTVDAGGGTYTHEQAMLCILLDIRDELQQINAVLGCANFQQIPRTLRRISSNTAKPRKRRRST